MSDQPGRENIGDELTTYSVDDEDQLEAAETLDADGAALEDGYEPPHRPHGSLAFGTTAAEQAQDETIDQRIEQEVPDPDSAYGAPLNESGLDDDAMLGGDDPDAIPADTDFVGERGGAVADLVSPDAGAERDTEAEAFATEAVGSRSTAAEEQAMHLVDEDAEDETPL